MIKTTRVDYDIPIAMRDGTVLRADIHRPADGDRHPAILFRSYNRLYGRSLPILRDLVDAGYAFVNSDLRGRGASGGEWKPELNFVVEGPDGYDTVEWIAEQDWCDGNVGTFGISHAACFQWLLAVERPPHLKAIAPWTGDFNEMFVPPRTGGAISFITTLIWLPREAADMVQRLENQGQDVGEMRRVLQWAQSNPAEVYHFLPLKDVPLARVGRLRELLHWRFHPISEPELAQRRPYEKITVPVFHECGWYDGAGWSEFENFNNMRKRGGSLLAREGQHLVCGPWPHASQFQATIGDINYGFSADSNGSRIHAHQIAFYDKYLRGKDTPLPALRYFVMGRNHWQVAEAWPLPETEWQRFYLHSQGGANTSAGDGLLSRDAPTHETPDTFIYDPHRPVPTVGGPLIGALPVPGCIAGPVEQSHVERRHDVLCYTTPPLSEDVEVTGPLQVHLYAATSAKDTDFTAKLAHVYPDGRSYNLAEGLIRARGRTLSAQRDSVEPGAVCEYVITLGQTSQLFRSGHRIRVDISSSNFPLFDRNMNTGNPIGEDALGVVAMQTIYHQAGYASYIDLPVVPQT